MKRKIICFEKEYNSIAELSREYNISNKTIYTRLKRGHSIEEAVTLTKEQAKINSLNNLKQSYLPLEEKEVRERMLKCGYRIINYTYKNNLTRMLCEDKDGYKVLMSLCGAETGAQAQRFSITYNVENFVQNVNLFLKDSGFNITVKEWRKGIRNRPEVLCVCKCGNTYWRAFNSLKNFNKSLCPKCLKSESSYEIATEDFLDSLSVKYEKQKTFKNCKNEKLLRFDFYLTEYNYCIEVDGAQHFKPWSLGSKTKEQAVKNFEKIKYNDNIKNEYCKNNYIGLLRIPYWEFDNNSNKYKQSILNILNT